MSSKMNEEALILGVISTVKASLNARIISINTEKNDSVTLKEINNEAYYFIDFPGDAPSYDPSIVYRIFISSEDSPRGSSSTRIGMGFELIFSDEMAADSETSLKRACRYRRALKETITKSVSPTYLVDIKDLPDVPWSERDQNFYSVGIGVEMTIAN